MFGIEDAYCKGCALCVSVCPKEVLALSGRFNSRGYFTAVLLAPQACTRCGLCALICPDAAIELICDAGTADGGSPRGGKDEA
jgi:2-oxoglutarate ferredoxin oxidoreductase subunit delta